MGGCASVIAIVIIAFLAWAFWPGSEPSPPASPPRTAASASIPIRIESEIGAVANVDVDVSNLARDGRALDYGARSLLDASRLDRLLNPATSMLNVTMFGRPKDGAPSPDRKILHLSIDRKVLRDLRNGAQTSDVVFNSAHDIGWWSPTNDDIVRSYCEDHSANLCADL